MGQEDFFNSLNVFHDGNYSRLSSLWEKYGNWKTAFKKEVCAPEPAKERKRLDKAGVKLFLSSSPGFPELLREIPFPPFGLYIKGSLDQANAVAVVGTRKATEEGLSLAYEFSSKIAGAGTCVVSGLAFGVDKSAHEGALGADGITWAVLPSGLDHIYPSSHETLAAKVLSSGGALISEYPLGHKPAKYNFLERNRLISGLARGSVIIEAPEVSGALATARFALEQNREVFVVPGPVKHRNYAGSHALIKNGAALVTSPEEILETLGISAHPNEKLASLEEKTILNVLSAAGKPLPMEEIVELSGISAPVASQTISFLLLKSKIKEHGESYQI